MKKLMNIFVFLSVLSLISCGGGGGRPETAAERFVNKLNYSDPFVSYTLAKDPTRVNGVIIIKNSHGEYRGIDITHMPWDSNSALSYFNQHSFAVWTENNGYFEDFWGNIYEKTTGTTKDLEIAGAILEKARVVGIGEQLATNYGLSEERGIEVAHMLITWKKLKAEGSLKESDVNALGKDLLGFDLASGIEAYKKTLMGDHSQMDKLIDQAAETNRITPEHAREILSKFME